jgi:hypothetical protein
MSNLQGYDNYQQSRTFRTSTPQRNALINVSTLPFSEFRRASFHSFPARKTICESFHVG